jgi:hypothetical protein
MFKNDELLNHIETSATIKTHSAIFAEWNLNLRDNTFRIGNYRYRPTAAAGDIYRTLPNSFDPDDQGNFYTGATDADIVIDGGFDDQNIPAAFISKKEKENILYSLEDCFNRFRPRSGINKLRYFQDKFSHFTNIDMARRPRYYLADKRDPFKYWTSYRTEDNIERGIASNNINNQYYIDDAAPFVVYKEPIPANRIVVKMQTHIGDLNLGPFATESGAFSDPFFGDTNKATPVNWKIQYLQDNNWIDAISFNSSSTRNDGSAIVKSDGYVEIQYGLIIPEAYRSRFLEIDQLSSVDFLPEASTEGHAYLVKENEEDKGVYYIWVTDKYESFVPEYGWQVGEEDVTSNTNIVRDLVSPKQYLDTANNRTRFYELEYISGVRVVVETMNKIDATFDLIEISPRLVADISERTLSFNISKTASDLGISGMPVSQLLASTGSLLLFDYDEAFNDNNESSIIAKYSSQNLQVKFYEIIADLNGYDYYVPIKTMYSETFPEINSNTRDVQIGLRDLFFYFESLTAPELLIQNASVSYAISTLLDSIGFSNYVFKRVAGEDEAIIPYFFVAPNQSIAQVLEDIAISTQSAMFFDEYNNFIVMSKDYMMPSENQRATDLVLYGTNTQIEEGIVKNKPTQEKLENIIDLSSQVNSVYNDGKINYTSRYIQRSFGTIRQASQIDRDKTWIYKPALLWEVAPEQNTKSVNNEISSQSAYALSAIPLNSSLSNLPPTVSRNRIINNTVDLGEAVYWLPRYNGYLYANGEIIKFDAVQYSIPGPIIKNEDPRLQPTVVRNPSDPFPITNPVIGGLIPEFSDNLVWITSVQEYQNYFSKLSFNGKIYPTGLVRIYSEPNYEVVEGITRLKDGPVAKHGRAQFGTEIVSHQAGVSSYWTSDTYARACKMDSTYLLEIKDEITITNISSSSTTFTANSPVVGVSVGQVVKVIGGTGRLRTDVVTKVTEILSSDEEGATSFRVSHAPTTSLSAATIKLGFYESSDTIVAAAGIDTVVARKTTRNGIIKNFLSNSFLKESEINQLRTTKSGTIQSSALVINGPQYEVNQKPLDYVSYVYKELTNKFKHFGTRMRIVGKIENNESRGQTPNGSVPYYVLPSNTPDQNVSIGGASGGIAVMINPSTNIGYYFEIAALTQDNIESYSNSGTVSNIFFYKVKKDKNSNDAIPISLWTGLSKIIVDNGSFTGQSRMVGEENPTVYDLAVEYEDLGSTRRFYLYINNKIIATVDDPDPLPIYNNMAVFVRGSARCMFENLYAITNNYSQNTAYTLNTPILSSLEDSELDTNEAFRKYALSGIVQASYLGGISPWEPPKYNIYFEEFGTIMREAAYFNVKYDKAYPALYAKISPTFNKIKGYVVSGFRAGAYGAEFLVFNSTDTILNLDETSGNYLRIQGITFTQQSSNELTVDDYFEKLSNLSDPQTNPDNTITSLLKVRQDFYDVKNSRIQYGKKDFNLSPTYIQSQDDANNLMAWMISKIMKPRKSMGVNIFANPMIQLGDIVKIDYTNNDGNEVIKEDQRFVVYNIQYAKSSDGPEMTVFLSEVI